MGRKKKSDKKKIIIQKIEENPDNKELIKESVFEYPEVLKYIDGELFKDMCYCKELLIINGMTLKYMSDEVKRDKNLVKIALNSSGGFALRYADDTLRADYEIVKQAILRYKKPLKYASEDLQYFFKEKWDKYYEQHPNQKWKSHKIIYNGIRTSKEEMVRIRKEENKK